MDNDKILKDIESWAAKNKVQPVKKPAEPPKPQNNAEADITRWAAANKK